MPNNETRFPCRKADSVSVDAFYLPTERGQRFCVLHPAEGTRRGAVLYVHPFGDEMNKSRRMAALQARAFARSGWDVLQIDLYGCGDSCGEFRDATWETWIGDVRTAWEWMERRTQAPVWLWGLRTGCLLAVAAARARAAPAQLLFWQPVLSGQRYLQQFLRTRLAGEAIEGQARRDTAALREALARDGVLEVSGYALSVDLAQGMNTAWLEMPPRGSEVRWIEVLPHAGQPLSEAAQRQAALWNGDGCRTSTTTTVGPPFWQTQEISECPALIASTISSMPQ